MSCCCTNIYPFCKMKVCDAEGVNLSPLVANIEGEYILQLNYMGAIYEIKKDFEVDEDLKFSSENLNENFEYKGILLDPNGDPVLFTIGEDETIYDCFTFKVVEFYNLTA